MKKLAGLFLVVAFSLNAFAQNEIPEPSGSRLFSTDLPRSPGRPRWYLLPPLLSVILPGIDQWNEGQLPSAVAYSGTALAGFWISAASMRTGGDDKSYSPSSRDDSLRGSMLGLQMYSAAGSFSAYHSFRSAVKTRKPLGEFGFLKHEETTDQLLLAPFQFRHLRRPTTWIPLAGLAVLSAVVGSQDGPLFRNNGYTDRDFAFGGAFSYLAGTHEEALFRGFVMPAMMESFGNEFWSNTTTALIFGAAHISSDNPVPWPQFIMGWYLGNLAQQNEWTLSESIFLHAWWDVIAFAGSYLADSRDERAVYLPLATIPF